MADKKPAESKGAFTDATTEEKLAKTEQQYKERTQDEDVDAGPDPIIDAAQKAADEAVKRAEDERDDDAPTVEDVTTARDDGGTTDDATSEAIKASADRGPEDQVEGESKAD